MTELATLLNPAQSSQTIEHENNAAEHEHQPMQVSSRNRRGGTDPFGRPSELLQKIGLRGKDVVRILKSRDWEVFDPKALQEHKFYYIPGGKAKGERATQGVDYFVGEGELYAYILEKGGLRFLLSEDGWSTETQMDSESDFEMLDQPPVQIEQMLQNGNSTATRVDKVVSEVQPALLESRRESGELLQESSTHALSNSDPQQPKRKRRKKLLTIDCKAAAKKNKPARRRVHNVRKKTTTNNSNDGEKIVSVPTERVKEEKIPFAAANGSGHFAELGAYEAALTAQGWRAQLLQDIDLHLLRSVAAIARRQLALEGAGGEQKLFPSPYEHPRPHEGVVQELRTLTSAIKASQNDLSSLIAVIIAQAEQVHSPVSEECAARIGISGFVSTGSGNLILMRDIERYLLNVVAALRQYLRARNTSSCTIGVHAIANSKRTDLRALQLNIEKMNAELTELATIISVQAENLSTQDFSAAPVRVCAPSAI